MYEVEIAEGRWTEGGAHRFDYAPVSRHRSYHAAKMACERAIMAAHGGSYYAAGQSDTRARITGTGKDGEQVSKWDALKNEYTYTHTGKPRVLRTMCGDEAQARAYVREVLKGYRGPIYCVLDHVSASGMMRVITPYKITGTDRTWLARSVATILDMPYDDRHEGVRVGGCGMDMGFHLVSSLCRSLYDDDYRYRQAWL